MTLATRQDAALEPVRPALLRSAGEQAAHAVAQARDAATALLARARQEAGDAVTRARADGAADARPVAMAQLSQGRRAARSVALGADLITHDEIAARIRNAVMALRDEPDYPLLRERLSSAAARRAAARWSR